MDVTGVTALATGMSQERVANEVQMAVLKKAMDVESKSALQLVQAASQPVPASNNPPHLGNNVDIFA